MTSLSEFAAQRRCPVCGLDPAVQAELQTAYEAGERYSIMIKWLREFHETAIFYEKMKNHFLNRHYERADK